MGNSKAFAETRDTVRLQPISLYCLLSIGVCKLKMSNWQGTLDSCLEAPEMDPSNIKALYCKVQRMQELKEHDQVLDDFRKAQEIALADKAT